MPPFQPINGHMLPGDGAVMTNLLLTGNTYILMESLTLQTVLGTILITMEAAIFPSEEQTGQDMVQDQALITSMELLMKYDLPEDLVPLLELMILSENPVALAETTD